MRCPRGRAESRSSTIAEGEPGSTRATAKLGECDSKQVHRNLSELEDIGVVGFEGGGPGRAKRPVMAYDGLEVDVSFGGSDGDVGTAAP